MAHPVEEMGGGNCNTSEEERMEAVPVVVLDESFLFSGDGDGDGDNDGAVRFLPGVETLLRRFQFSQLRVGISYIEEATSFKKVAFLKNVAMRFSVDSIAISQSSTDCSPYHGLLSWGGTGDLHYYVTLKRHENLFFKLHSLGWTIILKSCENVKDCKGELKINMIDELLLTVSKLIKASCNDPSVVTIGYIMKASREQDFAKRGAFPMYTVQKRIMFVPLSFDIPLALQIPVMDAVLHKATDEIAHVDPSNSDNFYRGITFSRNMQELQSYVDQKSECCIIDPIKNIYPLLDRRQIQEILLGLEEISTKTCSKIRAPHFLQVENFNEPDLEKRLAESKLVFPNIVKARVACGVADAHTMAIVFKTEDFKDLRVPLPAVVQEYIDHGSSIYKFYVLGDKVFYAVRKSLPNANVLLSSFGDSKRQAISFDSLKSLPIAKDVVPNGSDISALSKVHSLDVSLVTDAAHWLRRKLDLTILGFDVVIQEKTGDHVVVDVNYLPSFKEIADEVAIPAFWDALRSSRHNQKTKREKFISSQPNV